MRQEQPHQSALEQDRAIVTDIPGTTRDLVSEVAAIHGIPVKFVDTAAIRSGQDLVETPGIERSYQAMAEADVTLVVFDLAAPIHPDDPAADGTCNMVRALDPGRKKADLPRGRAVGRFHRSFRAHRRRNRSPALTHRPYGLWRTGTPASSPASGMSNCCAKASRPWRRLEKRPNSNPARNGAAGSLRHPTSSGRHNRSHHRRRYP